MDGNISPENRSSVIDQHSINIWEDPELQIFVENLELGGEAREMSEKEQVSKEDFSWVLHEEMDDIYLQSFWSDSIPWIGETTSFPSATLPYTNSNMEEYQYVSPPLPPPPHQENNEGSCMKWDDKVDAEVDRMCKKDEEDIEIDGGQQAIMFIVKSKVDLVDDGYSWRKYGEKNIKNRIYRRSYYRCTSNGCKIQKRVERSTKNPLEVFISYYGRHDHHPHH